MDNTIKIRDLTSPTEKKRVICYNTTADKAVYHNKDVRKLCDNFYIGEMEGDAYYKYCPLYAVYGENVGVLVDKLNADYSAEEIINLIIEKHKLGTLDGYIDNIMKRINNGVWVNVLEMEFLRNVKPELLADAEKARAAHRAKLDAERQAREDKRIAEKQEEMNADNAEAMEIINKAIETFKTKGTIRNDSFTVWTDIENSKGYCTFTYLFDKYGVKVPIRTRGFVIDRLASVTVDAEKQSMSYSYIRCGNSKGSNKLYDYLYALIDKINMK